MEESIGSQSDIFLSFFQVYSTKIISFQSMQYANAVYLYR